MASHLKWVVVFSGKRKSGKDYVTDLLLSRMGSERCSILRLSEPLKRQYALDHGLDLTRLLDATEYKEHYRADMIRWGEEKRNADPSYFCNLVTTGPGSEKPVWIISDARRLTDVAYFEEHYAEQLIRVRVQAKESVRESRGWKFAAGVDDAESECGLDGFKNWDYVIENNGSKDQLEPQLSALVAKLES